MHLRGQGTRACPECRALVPPEEMERHLRRVHQVYQFRDVRHPLPEMTADLFAAVCSPRPDQEAWQALEALAHDEYGPEAESFLAAGLSRALAGLDPARRSDAVNAAAEVIAASGRGAAIAVLLAGLPEPLARHLALTLATLLAGPLSSEMMAALRPLLK